MLDMLILMDREEKSARLMEAAMAVLQEAPGQELNIVLLMAAREEAAKRQSRQPQAIDMMIAIQQDDLLDEDPWLSEPPNEELRASFREATDQAGEPF